MVVEIVVTLAQRIHALAQQGQLIVSDVATVAGIREFCIDGFEQPRPSVSLPEQQQLTSPVISPPENLASIRRRFTGGKSKLTRVPSVMGKVQFEFTVTN